MENAGWPCSSTRRVQSDSVNAAARETALGWYGLSRRACMEHPRGCHVVGSAMKGRNVPTPVIASSSRNHWFCLVSRGASRTLASSPYPCVLAGGRKWESDCGKESVPAMASLCNAGAMKMPGPGKLAAQQSGVRIASTICRVACSKRPPAQPVVLGILEARSGLNVGMEPSLLYRPVRGSPSGWRLPR